MRHHGYHQTEELLTTFAIVERVAELHDCTLIIPEESWESNQRRYNAHEVWTAQGYQRIDPNPAIPVEFSSSYGDWDEVKSTDELDPSKVYVIPQYCGGSDYSGSLVERSNYDALQEMFPKEWEEGN